MNMEKKTLSTEAEVEIGGSGGVVDSSKQGVSRIFTSKIHYCDKYYILLSD